MYSVVGHSVPNTGNPQFNVYPASKHAVTALTESLRQELNFLKTKIKVTSVSPGVVETEIIQASAIGSGIALKEDHFKDVKDYPKLKAEDIANAVIYVLSTPAHVQVHELIIKPVGESF